MPVRGQGISHHHLHQNKTHKHRSFVLFTPTRTHTHACTVTHTRTQTRTRMMKHFHCFHTPTYTSSHPKKKNAAATTLANTGHPTPCVASHSWLSEATLRVTLGVSYTWLWVLFILWVLRGERCTVGGLGGYRGIESTCNHLRGFVRSLSLKSKLLLVPKVFNVQLRKVGVWAACPRPPQV